MRCIVWPKSFVDCGEKVVADAVVLAKGKIDRRGGGDEANLIVDELIPLDDLDSRYTHGMRIKLDEDAHDRETLNSLREILRGYPGKQEMLFSMQMNGGEVVHMRVENTKSKLHQNYVDGSMTYLVKAITS